MIDRPDTAFQVFAAVLWLLSGFCWHRTSIAGSEVKRSPIRGGGDHARRQTAIADRIDALSIVIAQSNWNEWAAYWAALAAVNQMIAVLVA